MIGRRVSTIVTASITRIRIADEDSQLYQSYYATFTLFDPFHGLIADELSALQMYYPTTPACIFRPRPVGRAVKLRRPRLQIGPQDSNNVRERF